MTYPRVIGRNGLQGDYDGENATSIGGDLRRLERDALDERYGQEIADSAGVPIEVSRAVLLAFFSDCGGRGWIPAGWSPPFTKSVHTEDS